MTPPVPKAEPSCATAFSRSCRNFSRQFVYEGGKRVRGGVFSGPPPLPLRRNFFNIRIRVGPPTRAPIPLLPRRRRLVISRSRAETSHFAAKQPPSIGSISPFGSQDQSTDNFSMAVWLILPHWIPVERFFARILGLCASKYLSLSLFFRSRVSLFLIARVGKRVGWKMEKEGEISFFKELFVGTDFPWSVRSTFGKKREFPYGWDGSLRFLINRSLLRHHDDINEMEVVDRMYPYFSSTVSEQSTVCSVWIFWKIFLKIEIGFFNRNERLDYLCWTILLNLSLWSIIRI